MRSAIYYPEIEISSVSTMRSALLLWDELKVIAPFGGFQPHHDNRDIAAAWELIGGAMLHDRAQKHMAHDRINEMLEAGVSVDVFYRDDGPPGRSYEMWPQKLLPETRDLLRQHGLTGGPLANGDYPFEELGGLAVMAKLADACAGQTLPGGRTGSSPMGLSRTAMWTSPRRPQSCR